MKNLSAGYLVEFDEAQEILNAVRFCMAQGYSQLEAYTPFPIEELDESLPKIQNHVAMWSFVGGLVFACIGYGIQYYSAVIDFPILAGGKPMHSWPAFLLVTFEMTILGAALTAFFCAIWCNGLPRLYDPLFDVPEFNLASANRFFLYIITEGSEHSAKEILADIKTLKSTEVYPVGFESDQKS